MKNGVPADAIIGEDQSGHTRDNAFLSRNVVDEKGIEIKTASIVCKAFHARRCLMLYQIAFPDVEIMNRTLYFFCSLPPADVFAPYSNCVCARFKHACHSSSKGESHSTASTASQPHRWKGAWLSAFRAAQSRKVCCACSIMARRIAVSSYPAQKAPQFLSIALGEIKALLARIPRMVRSAIAPL